MGQQQLILLVLATVIVGLAIVVGIQAFTENSARSNADAMMQDAVRIANDIQAWGQKPLQFGGPDAAADEDFTSVGFPDIGYEAAAATGPYINLNGEFTLTPAADNVLITGESFGDGDNTGDAFNEVQVIVCGTTSERDIVGRVMTIRGEVVNAASPECPGAAL